MHVKPRQNSECTTVGYWSHLRLPIFVLCAVATIVEDKKIRSLRIFLDTPLHSPLQLALAEIRCRYWIQGCVIIEFRSSEEISQPRSLVLNDVVELLISL